MTCLARWIRFRLTVVAWDVPLTRGPGDHRVWVGMWSRQARRWVRM